MNRDRPKLIIIGAGIAGMATGAYAQMNGFDSQIFEMHVLPGGCCTSWSRGGYVFDYCIEFLVGTGDGAEGNQIWRELGALDGKRITNFDLLSRVEDEHGRAVTFYNDPDRLERHLLEVSPEDTKLIRGFCADIRKLVKHGMNPPLKPWALMTWGERLKMVRDILPMFRLTWRTAATPLEKYCLKFKSPLLRRALPCMLSLDIEGFPMLPSMYALAKGFNRNAGFPEGGSLGLAKSIEDRYRSLGGEIRYRSKVTKILTEGDRAVGVELSDGSRHHADAVVSACDGKTTIYKMLEGRYLSPTIEKLYKELLVKPRQTYPGTVTVCLGVNRDAFDDESHTTTYLLDDADAASLPAGSKDHLFVQHRSRYSSGFAPPGKSVLQCGYFNDSAHWMKLRAEDRARYRQEKDKVARFVQEFLERRYPGLRDKTEVVSVTTPATLERYTGTHNGSVLSWKGFTEAEDLAHSLVNKHGMQLPGLRGFYMAGQWINGGGLFRAAVSGRFVVQYICRDLERPFQASVSSSGNWNSNRLDDLPQLDDLPEESAAASG